MSFFSFSPSANQIPCFLLINCNHGNMYTHTGFGTKIQIFGAKGLDSANPFGGGRPKGLGYVKRILQP